MVAKTRILIVDDEPTIRASCTRIFEEQGYDVQVAGGGQEGLQLAQQRKFDCALVDLRMPDIDGMEVIRQARERDADLSIVVMTGYGSVKTAAEATRLGVADYVCKPFEPDQIVRAVEQALDRARMAGPSRAIAHVLDRLEEVRLRPELLEPRSPKAVAQIVTQAVGVAKAKAPVIDTLLLGALAGVYIGFGAALATLVGHDAASRVGVGLAQVAVGTVFSVGLILVVLAGAELFTGNSLMVASVLGRECRIGRLLGRWGLVYVANFVGAVLFAGLMYGSGLWRMASCDVGAKAVSIAVAKVNLSFGEAFLRGVGCNWLVCLAVWMALSARDVAGKILAILFPIMAFVALGYEHCVANMYFVPIGIFLKGTAAAATMDAAILGTLTWPRFLTANLVPVTLGNVVGGTLFVGCLYWFVYMRRPRVDQQGGTAPAARSRS